MADMVLENLRWALAYIDSQDAKIKALVEALESIQGEYYIPGGPNVQEMLNVANAALATVKETVSNG